MVLKEVSVQNGVKLTSAFKVSVSVRKLFYLNSAVLKIRIGDLDDVLRQNKWPKAINDIFLLILLYMKSDQQSIEFTVKLYT